METKSVFKTAKKKETRRPNFSKQGKDKKREKADSLCAHFKSQKLRDKCYKDKGVFTSKMKNNNKKRLQKAADACAKVKGS